MELRIALAANVNAGRSMVYDILRTTEGQRGFWTSDCELDDLHGRFSFAQAPVDLNVSIALVADELVRMKVESGFPGWNGSTWEWVLVSHDASSETSIQFRHYDFEPSYTESELAYTAQTWALILDRLVGYVVSGEANPYFSNSGA